MLCEVKIYFQRSVFELGGGGIETLDTYCRPVAKRRIMPILFRRGSCMFHIVHAGSKRIATSDMMLKRALMSIAIF